MAKSNFPEHVLAGEHQEYQNKVEELYHQYGFDFVAIGLTAFVGAPLRWIYSAGATGERYRRIVLAPGQGIGGIVIKAGKPMLFTDIDKDIDPREYSSYPIVFAEDLRSFCAMPLKKKGKVVGSLLCAFRTVNISHTQSYKDLINDIEGKICDLDVGTSDFLNFEDISRKEMDERKEPLLFSSDLSRVISAQENERKRISRELHDGIIQELLSVSFMLRQLSPHITENEEALTILEESHNNIDRILDELHNITVELRPSALDHLGFIPALRSQASVFEKAYGAEIVFEGGLSRRRFNRSLETQAYRICQEAILNACKYSNTERIDVALEDSGDWLHVTITDYGQGFDVENPVVKGSGCGLVGMHERATLIGASLQVESSDKGTVITLVAPMGPEQGEK